jgi:hypothetical protein
LVADAASQKDFMSQKKLAPLNGTLHCGQRDIQEKIFEVAVGTDDTLRHHARPSSTQAHVLA